jgi:hypothetical protein
MSRGIVSWKRRTEDGEKREIYAQQVGTEWRFFIREKRFDQWEPFDRPELEDWLELLDSVRRRIARRLVRPEEETRVRKMIRERFPNWAEEEDR